MSRHDNLTPSVAPALKIKLRGLPSPRQVVPEGPREERCAASCARIALIETCGILRYVIWETHGGRGRAKIEVAEVVELLAQIRTIVPHTGVARNAEKRQIRPRVEP